MLKISEMAQLAKTTRRTLIFYDEQGVFQPAKKTANGYRYYDYNQLYDLLFILGLKQIGLSLEEIKQVKDTSNTPSKALLVRVENRVDEQIAELTKVQATIQKKLNHQARDYSKLKRNIPFIDECRKSVFWCSEQSVDCTEEEIATLFSRFYQNLGNSTLLDDGMTGYLTDLSVTTPEQYDHASFRIIKSIDERTQAPLIPTIEKEAGKYVSVLVKNDLNGIHQGLRTLENYCAKNKLLVDNHLWQLNTSNKLIHNGASEYGLLQYRIKK